MPSVVRVRGKMGNRRKVSAQFNESNGNKVSEGTNVLGNKRKRKGDEEFNDNTHAKKIKIYEGTNVLGNKRKRKETGESNEYRNAKKVKIYEEPKLELKMPKPKAGLSMLELLPTEILEKVHLFSETPKLPLLSPALFAKLNSNYTKTQLVLRYFAHPEYQRHFERCFVKAQSTLLRMRWLTWDFFRTCQKDFMVKTAMEALKSHMIDHSREDEAEACSKLMNGLDRAFKLGGTMVEYYERLRSENRDANAPAGKLKVVLVDMPGLMIEIRPSGGGNLSQLTVTKSQSDGKEKEETLTCMPANPTSYPEHKPLNIAPRNSNPLRHFTAPSKLLHGPWTQARGDFLSMLVSAGARVVGMRNHNSEVARHGLVQAILENCEPALKLLTDGVDRRFHIAYERDTLASKQFWRQFTSSFKDEVAPDPEGPWILGSVFYRPNKDGKVIVRPSGMHVVAALEVASRDPARDFRLVVELTTQIFDDGCEAPEVVSWAEQHMIQENLNKARHGVGWQVLHWYQQTCEQYRIGNQHDDSEDDYLNDLIAATGRDDWPTQAEMHAIASSSGYYP